MPSTAAVLCTDLNLTVRKGHSLLIMGPSGAGKTTILRTIAGLWSHGSGSIVLHGQPMGRQEGQVGLLSSSLSFLLPCALGSGLLHQHGQPMGRQVPQAGALGALACV